MAESRQRPNVLLITADQLRGDVLGCMGNPYIQTPHLDQLAYTGTMFTGAFSECPACVPARWCLMTGKHTYTHGLHGNDHVRLTARPTLPQVFGEAGYQTQAIGKLHVAPQRDRIGFDHVVLNEEGRRLDTLRLDDYEMYLQERGLLQQAWAHGMPANGLQSRPHPLPEEHMMDAWTAREACRFLERRDPTAPFFLYVSFRNPHPPLTPPKVYWDMYRDQPVREPVLGSWLGPRDPAWLVRVRMSTNCDLQGEAERRQAIRAYYAMVTSIDHQIGFLLGDLRERRLLGNTIVLFTADHGEMLFDHNTAHKVVFYQGSARIPMIAAVPPRLNAGRFGAGAACHQPVMLQDVMPTLADLAGIPIPDGLDGRSFAPLMADGRAPWREYAFGDHWGGVYGLTDNRMKYLYYAEGGIEQLFDVANDPDELTDLAGDAAHADTLAMWRQRLIAELEKHGDENAKDGRLVPKPYPQLDLKQERVRSGWNVRGAHWPSI